MFLKNAELPFKVEIPFEVFRKAGTEKGQERRIGGVISTESKDRQNEVVLQRGLDFSEFIRAGWFNDNHSRETTGIVGYPLKVERRTIDGKAAHYVEGYLLEGYPPADRIWELANSLQATGRRLGFSIEGAVTRRDGDQGQVIAQAKVRNVAITNCPVNTDTGLEVLAKSLQAMEQEGEALIRALMAGYASTAQGTLTPGAATPGSGAPLRTQSIEAKPKRDPKRLRKAEVLAWLERRYPGLEKSDAERLYQYIAARAAH